MALGDVKVGPLTRQEKKQSIAARMKSFFLGKKFKKKNPDLFPARYQ